MDRIHLPQDRFHWRTLEKINENSGSIKGGKFIDQISDY
jgi:hypothetical protein